MSDTILDADFREEDSTKNRLFNIIRWWERRRLLYNGILLVFGLFLIVIEDFPVVNLWPEDWIFGLVTLVIGANVGYLMGWNFELLSAYYFNYYLTDFKRWALWVTGVIFSLAVFLGIYYMLALSVMFQF